MLSKIGATEVSVFRNPVAVWCAGRLASAGSAGGGDEHAEKNTDKTNAAGNSLNKKIFMLINM